MVKFQQERESEATAGLTGEELQEEADRHLQVLRGLVDVGVSWVLERRRLHSSI